jgi:VanZ family protein
MIEHRWIRVGCIAAAFFMAAMIFFRADTGAGIPLPPPWDKVVHFLYYGAMALLLAHGVGRRWLWIPLVLVPVIGAADEWNQAGISGRDASIFDWVADELGTLLAVYVYYRWREKSGAEVRGTRAE